MNNGFDGNSSRCLASFSGSVSGDIWLLGDSVRFLASASDDRITGEQAVARMRVILGTPEAFAANMKASTQDFIADHFGAMAIACAFGIAIRMRG
ncbi:hypothetical protein [Microcoleus sp. OTE_8_concoct_300]|uniref:hypothetical protein n=1 Tax=Microcoleus sp. OTE_8_concoct_300 TaxID=2964710 RepID=UPI00403F420A